jgi:hypothetical protein
MRTAQGMSQIAIAMSAIGIVLICGGLLLTLGTGCEFTPGTNFGSLCNEFDEAPLATIASTNVRKVFEDLGIIAVHHGFACAESKKNGRQDILKVHQGLRLPGYASGAVLLNGWNLQYLNGKHNVAAMTTMIRNIQSERENLQWDAIGALTDRNFDDSYQWCYRFTVIAWNPAAINLVIDQDGDACSIEAAATPAANYFISTNEGTETALFANSTFLSNPQFASKEIAVLPRGFGYMWGGTATVSLPDDHNLLQVAYHMDHSEIIMQKDRTYQKVNGPATHAGESTLGPGSVSWEATSIFKDNDARREYSFGEIVSGLSGDEVDVIQPPFSILPKEDTGWFSACLGPSASSTENVRIDNVSYKYVIPMLTGWDLPYGCSNVEIDNTGTWIEDFQYDHNNPGTLTYTVTTKPGGHHKVSLLALRPVTLGLPIK